MKKLSRRFYARPTLLVAQDLLGKFLVMVDCGNNKILNYKINCHNKAVKYRIKACHRLISGMIVETEAYIGEEDLACHASRGRTRRTEVMFGEPGHAYIYMIYGMYYCLNVVTEKKDFPAAVLIRALEPKEGIEKMIKNRKFKKSSTLFKLTSGPGKLCQAFGIDKSLNGADLTGNKIWIEDRGIKIKKKDIVQTKRIGVDYAGKCRNYPWRFYIKGNKFVSVN